MGHEQTPIPFSHSSNSYLDADATTGLTKLANMADEIVVAAITDTDCALIGGQSERDMYTYMKLT